MENKFSIKGLVKKRKILKRKHQKKQEDVNDISDLEDEELEDKIEEVISRILGINEDGENKKDQVIVLLRLIL